MTEWKIGMGTWRVRLDMEDFWLLVVEKIVLLEG